MTASQFVIVAVGYGFLWSVDWRIPVGVCLVGVGNALYLMTRGASK